MHTYGVKAQDVPYKSTAQAMPTASTWYTCTFENIETNEGGITYANGIFTVPIAGQYMVNWGSHIQGTTTSTTRAVFAAIDFSP